jgi:hypothetical protein
MANGHASAGREIALGPLTRGRSPVVAEFQLVKPTTDH